MKNFRECTKQEKARRVHTMFKNCNCSDGLWNKYYDYIDFKNEDVLNAIYDYVHANLSLRKHIYYLEGNRAEYQNKVHRIEQNGYYEPLDN